MVVSARESKASPGTSYRLTSALVDTGASTDGIANNPDGSVTGSRSVRMGNNSFDGSLVGPWSSAVQGEDRSDGTAILRGDRNFKSYSARSINAVVQGADVDILNLFKHETDTQSHAAASVIFHKGDDARSMYVVLRGEVDIMLEGRVLTTETAGSIFGEMALIGDHRRSADAIAKSDCVLVSIDERRFAFLVGQTPYFALHVMQLLGERIRRKERSG